MRCVWLTESCEAFPDILHDSGSDRGQLSETHPSSSAVP